jgi:hypothetical protein
MKKLTALLLLGVFTATPFMGLAQDNKETKEKPKPYPLQTCIVSDEKLGDMGEPYVFTESGQEIKMCCKSCLKEFNKDKAKYLKKLEAKPDKK